MGKRYCFDLDGALCTTVGGEYKKVQPYLDRITKVNKLYDEGNYIIVETTRDSVTGIDWHELTNNQLNEWGVKIAADIYIDDKGNDLKFFDYE